MGFQIQNFVAMSASLFSLSLKVYLCRNSSSEVLVGFQMKQTEMHVSASHLNMEASQIFTEIESLVLVLSLKTYCIGKIVREGNC